VSNGDQLGHFFLQRGEISPTLLFFFCGQKPRKVERSSIFFPGRKGSLLSLFLPPFGRSYREGLFSCEVLFPFPPPPPLMVLPGALPFWPPLEQEVCDKPWGSFCGDPFFGGKVRGGRGRTQFSLEISPMEGLSLWPDVLFFSPDFARGLLSAATLFIISSCCCFLFFRKCGPRAGSFLPVGKKRDFFSPSKYSTLDSLFVFLFQHRPPLTGPDRRFFLSPLPTRGSPFFSP